MMKWFVLSFILVLLPLMIYAGHQPMTRRLLFPDSLNAKLNKLVLDELQRRLPKNRQWYFSEQPALMPWHNLTNHVSCKIQLPNTRTQDIQEALNIFVPYVRAYMDTLNNVQEIRPYMTSFPCSFESVFFLVDFARDSKTGMLCYDPYIAGVTLECKKLVIDQLYKEKKLADGRIASNVYENIYKTPDVLPEEFQKLAIPNFDTKKVPKEIPEAKTYSYRTEDMEEEFSFAQNVAKENGLLFIAFERIWNRFVEDLDVWKVSGIELAFAAQEKYITLEEGKELVSKIRQAILAFGTGYKKLENRLNACRKKGIESLLPSVDIQHYTSFRISFWDKYIDRVKQPNIAEIKVIGSRARYYVADELQRPQLIHEEDLPPYYVDVPLSPELLQEKPKEK